MPPATDRPDQQNQSEQLYAVPTLRDHVGRIVAAVMINGRGPFRFMLDTGSNRTVLAQSPTLANTALLKVLNGNPHTSQPASPSNVFDVTATSQPGLTGRVPAIRLGEAIIHNLDVTFGDFPIFIAWGLQHEPAVLIGMDALGTLPDLDIDYRRMEIDVLPRATPPALVEKKWFSFTSW